MESRGLVRNPPLPTRGIRDNNSTFLVNEGRRDVYSRVIEHRANDILIDTDFDRTEPRIALEQRLDFRQAVRWAVCLGEPIAVGAAIQYNLKVDVVAALLPDLCPLGERTHNIDPLDLEPLREPTLDGVLEFAQGLSLSRWRIDSPLTVLDDEVDSSGRLLCRLEGESAAT